MSLDFPSNIAAPPRVRCIGVDLLPYSLGHHIRLLALESPFVTGQGFPGFGDLVSAAFICAHTWEEFERMGKWQRWLRLKLWGMLSGKFDPLASILALKLLIRQSTELPESKRERNTVTVHLFSQWETRLYHFLRSSGFSHAEAMDTPLVVANLMLCAHLESTGQARYKSQLDYAMDDALTRSCEEVERGERSMPA